MTNVVRTFQFSGTVPCVYRATYHVWVHENPKCGAGGVHVTDKMSSTMLYECSSMHKKDGDDSPIAQAYLHEIFGGDGMALRQDTADMQRIAGHLCGLIVGGVFLSPDSVVGAVARQPDSSTLFARVLCTLYTAYVRECLRMEEHCIDVVQRVFEVYQNQDTIFAVVERLHDGNFVPYDYRFVVGKDSASVGGPEFLFVFVREERHSECYSEFWAAAREGMPVDFYSSSSSVVAQWLKSTALEAYLGSEFLVGGADVGNDEEVRTLSLVGGDFEGRVGASVVVGHQLCQAPQELWEKLVAVQTAATDFVRVRRTFGEAFTH